MLEHGVQVDLGWTQVGWLSSSTNCDGGQGARYHQAKANAAIRESAETRVRWDSLVALVRHGKIRRTTIFSRTEKLWAGVGRRNTEQRKSMDGYSTPTRVPQGGGGGGGTPRTALRRGQSIDIGDLR